MRCLSVDLGTKRIGLALSEPEGKVVSPLKVIEARPSLEETARAILDVAREYDAGTVVIGLPLNMDGTEGPQVKLSKALADALRRVVAQEASLRDGSSSKGRPPLEVCLHDERLTSHAADQLLADRKLTRKKKRARQDAVAAQVLLQSYLRESRNGSGHG